MAGKAGYESIRRGDEQGLPPGAENIRALFGGKPALILLDELSIFLRRAKQIPGLADQLTPFLSNLFKAVEGTPNAALVYTLAIGKEYRKKGKTGDAYSEENLFIADKMAEAESVSARKATLLNPTQEGETVKVLQRRLFSRIDAAGAAEVIEAYSQLWNKHKDLLPAFGAQDDRLQAFKDGYPMHPELIATLTNKTATLENFQRIRGMLRLLV
ncbi:MAG: DUF499 domain-containing protein, partial [Gammaproteobacteria bacterium]|nr:DUF499 domain-containing protein [Gammaproteobacteria bacterium]